jgi:hypothetical protein
VSNYQELGQSFKSNMKELSEKDISKMKFHVTLPVLGIIIFVGIFVVGLLEVLSHLIDLVEGNTFVI